jgi:hydroxylamine reductase (hybrid-cluster protein)
MTKGPVMINADIVKARITELQSDVDRVKSNLQALKESSKGNAQAEDMQKLDELTRELIAYKSGQAELIALLS